MTDLIGLQLQLVFKPMSLGHWWNLDVARIVWIDCNCSTKAALLCDVPNRGKIVWSRHEKARFVNEAAGGKAIRIAGQWSRIPAWIEANSLGLLKRLSVKPNGDRVDDHLRVELLKLLYETMPVVLIVNLANGTLIAAVFFRSLPSTFVFSWWALLVSMTVLRAAALLWYRRNSEKHKFWGRVAVVGSGCSGLLWGVAGFFSMYLETKRTVWSWSLFLPVWLLERSII